MAHASEIVSYLGRSSWRVREVPVSIRYTEYSRSKGQSLLNGVNILFDLSVRHRGGLSRADPVPAAARRTVDLFVFVRSSGAIYVQASKRIALVLFALVERLRGDAARRPHAVAHLLGVGPRHRPGALRAGGGVHGRHVQLLPALPRGGPPLHRARPHRRDPRGRAGQPGARPAAGAGRVVRRGAKRAPDHAEPPGHDTVDVMLPHYGRLDLVQDTVRSVLAQDDPHWRLTVVDDSGDLPDEGLPPGATGWPSRGSATCATSATWGSTATSSAA